MNRTVSRLPTLVYLILLSLQLPAADFSAPLITLPIAHPIEKGASSYRISAEVSDETGLVSVDVHYRYLGDETEFKTLALTPSRGDSIYATSIKIDTSLQRGIEYYIEARDSANNISEEPFPDTPRQIHFPNAQHTQKSNKKKYLWIALGALAVGAVAANASEGSKKDDSVTLDINAANP